MSSNEWFEQIHGQSKQSPAPRQCKINRQKPQYVPNNDLHNYFWKLKDVKYLYEINAKSVEWWTKVTTNRRFLLNIRIVKE